MVGYSRLVERDEAEVIRRQKEHRLELIDPLFQRYHGRIIKLTGDGLIAEFTSVVEAVQCALEVQVSMTKREADYQDEDRIRYRMAINLGDVIQDEGDILGDGVNIAARLETLAEPGGLVISGSVYDLLKSQVKARYQFLGEKHLKNISSPVRVYQVENAMSASSSTAYTALLLRRTVKTVGVGAIVALFLSIGMWAVYQRFPSGSDLLGTSVQQETSPIVAVTPFVNLANEASQDYLAMGLAEDLLTDLSRGGRLKVLSRSASFNFREEEDAASFLQSTYGATHLIEGSVQRQGDRIRIRVQLVEIDTGTSIWAERFDRKIDDLFDLQDEVRSNILVTLSGQLDFEPGSARASEVSAYDLLLQGRYHEAALTEQGVERAIRLYKASLDVDPGYGEAYARLANMYEFRSRFNWGASPGIEKELALKMADRAVDLDPTNPFAHWTRARVLSRLDGSDESAQSAFMSLEKSLATDPNFADGYAFKALMLAGEGEIAAAREAIDLAYRLNLSPQSWYYRNRGIISFFEQNYEIAISDFERASELNATAHSSRIWLAAALAKLGEIDDAEWELEEGLALGAPDTVGEVLKSNKIIRYPAFRRAYAEGLLSAGLPE